MKKAPLEIAVYILGAFLLAVLFGFGSYAQELMANSIEFESHYVGALVYEDDLPNLLELHPNTVIIEANEKPLETARSYNYSDFVVAVIDPSREDATFDAIHQTTFDRVISGFEFERVKYLAINNPDEIKTALYYFNLVGAQSHKIIDGIYYFKKGQPNAENQAITLLGFGDVMLGRYVRILMDLNGMNYPFEHLGGSLKGTDFVHANFEGPIKEVYVRTGKSIEFRFKPDVIWPLKDSGINIVTIANNHALDQGWIGREETKKYLNEAGIRFFGHPDAYMTEVGGKKVAFVGYDDTIFKIDETEARELISGYDAIADYVIVSVHWGAEYKHTPLQRKVWLAHLFVDSGADLVIGHHPHVVQTMEIYNGVPVFYSLGNFVFDQYWSGDTQEGMGIGVEFKNNDYVVYLYPYALPRSQPEFMVGEARSAFLEKFISWGAYDDELTAQIRAGKVEIKRN